jgi:hypothetical protein
MDSLIVGVAIGLVFVFAVVAALTSALTEAVARFLGLRGDFLLRGIRALVDGQVDGPPKREEVAQIEPATPPATPTARGATATGQPDSEPPSLMDDLLRNALFASQGQQGLMPSNSAMLSWKQKRRLPGYLSSRTFARAVISYLVPDASGKTSFDQIDRAIDRLPDGVLKKSLRTLAVNADGRIEALRESIEQWYDDHMDRVSGWYKRHVRQFSIGIGILLILAFNVNAVSITRALYTDQALRESVVTQAVGKATCDKEPADCLREVRKEIEGLRSFGLPVGWAADPVCGLARATPGTGDDCSFAERFGLADRTGDRWVDVRFVLVLLVGYALMVLALLPGARFWFDLLGKLGSLRSSGPKPPRA